MVRNAWIKIRGLVRHYSRSIWVEEGLGCECPGPQAVRSKRSAVESPRTASFDHLRRSYKGSGRVRSKAGHVESESFQGEVVEI
ncbi:hypothetical protein P691DRAFT_272743 [Macrolepiota fuliginosa MF-IS2]|uniref:Uncharacterized protein n=1 Tax=Macrolepiota fuliginosa MF-IS2 TaxID=1400762 RepID=A0A9P5X8L8_9AGAR|nr:hypothetical protein P691DRAFT_272743 [Macrolepiota fuliginosa MF-IS2]